MADIDMSFLDFPEDVQLCILSFLTPSEISSFSLTSKRSLSLCQNDSKLWFSLCHRRWGSKTLIHKWANSQIPFKSLYKTLSKWDTLIGFWRCSGHKNPNSPPLLFFEWGPSFITGSILAPSTGFRVTKIPFLFMGLSSRGEPIIFLDPDRRFESSGDFIEAVRTQLGFSDADLIRVVVNFIGGYHFAIEESKVYANFRWGDLEDVIGAENGSLGSPPECVKSEIYRYFANRTSPCGDRASRRQRKREKQLQGRRKWEKVHYVKIVNYSPTPSRPLQGLWKEIVLQFEKTSQTQTSDEAQLYIDGNCAKSRTNQSTEENDGNKGDNTHITGGL
ncbi:F-box family protein isoform X2 [Tasmannia lanceolata]|uniref:F-box family protein isoform X2 n=1 Tax=Tasmannia lanceolata TaxID=3420 RepID=UPI0040628055